MKNQALRDPSFTRYVLGFLFNPNGSEVLLIQKTHPQWMNGLYNGIGGKAEKNETPMRAMHREFLEEAGVELNHWDCRLILTNTIVRYRIWIFSAFDTHIEEAQSLTDEPIRILPVINLPTLPVLPNLHWMIPMLLDRTVKLAEIRDGGNK